MPTMDEEAQKRNTDCVYFLASPLTCKKGNDCEYRHSESARINPRDCWFWIVGNCLNANCTFRHPPLDGRPAASPATATSTAAAAAAAAAAATAAAAAASKSRVPCFFFSQGFCAKGDKCAFMHGLVPPSTTEASASQKPSKPAALKATESNDKQGTGSKGNGSATSKPPPESFQGIQDATETRPRVQSEAHFVYAKANRAAQEPVLMVNDVTRVRKTEGSASSGPARPRSRQAPLGDDRFRQVPLTDDRLHQAQPADDNSRQFQPGEDRFHEAQPGDDRLRQVQTGDDRLRQVQSVEDRIQNDMESEEWLEESSPGFDVLVDDGPDQLVYVEDVEYLSHHDVAIESGRSHIRGRMMQTDDLAEFEYDHSGAYDQSGYYDASAQYDHATYDPYEQQLGYDHVNSYDHVGRQQAVAYNDRHMEGMLLQDRDRRGMVLEVEIRRGASSGDLRNHIVKRRRAERGQQLGDDQYRRRHHQKSRRHQDDHPKQQEVLVRHRILAQPGTRANQRSHGRVESVGNKRAYHDIGSDYEGASSEKISNKRSPNKRNLGELVRAKVKRKERGRLATEAAVVSEPRGYATSINRKADSKQDDSTFAGPKSLAQIKAEKRKAVGEESSKARDMPEEPKSSTQSLAQTNSLAQRQVLPIKSQISPASGSVFETARKEASSGEEKKISLGKVVTQEVTRTPNFEGPKPLSAILKAKRKGDSEGELRFEEVMKEQAPKRISLRSDMEAVTAGSMAVSKTIYLSPVTNKELEDGELIQDINLALVSRPQGLNRNERKHGELSQQDLTNHRDRKILRGEPHMAGSISKNRVEVVKEEAQRSRAGEEVGKGLDRTDDMEGGVEAGDNVMEDVEFDDDEDDDFAKKLGGFFS